MRIGRRRTATPRKNPRRSLDRPSLPALTVPGDDAESSAMVTGPVPTRLGSGARRPKSQKSRFFREIFLGTGSKKSRFPKISDQTQNDNETNNQQFFTGNPNRFTANQQAQQIAMYGNLLGYQEKSRLGNLQPSDVSFLLNQQDPIASYLIQQQFGNQLPTEQALMLYLATGNNLELWVNQLATSVNQLTVNLFNHAKCGEKF